MATGDVEVTVNGNGGLLLDRLVVHVVPIDDIKVPSETIFTLSSRTTESTMHIGLPGEDTDPALVSIVAPGGRDLVSFVLDETRQVPRVGEEISLQPEPATDAEDRPEDGSYIVDKVVHNFRHGEDTVGAPDLESYVIYVFVRPAESEPPMEERDWNEITTEEIEELYVGDERITDEAVEE